MKAVEDIKDWLDNEGITAGGPARKVASHDRRMEAFKRRFPRKFSHGSFHQGQYLFR